MFPPHQLGICWGNTSGDLAFNARWEEMGFLWEGRPSGGERDVPKERR